MENNETPNLPPPENTEINNDLNFQLIFRWLRPSQPLIGSADTTVYNPGYSFSESNDLEVGGDTFFAHDINHYPHIVLVVEYQTQRRLQEQYESARARILNPPPDNYHDISRLLDLAENLKPGPPDTTWQDGDSNTSQSEPSSTDSEVYTTESEEGEKSTAIPERVKTPERTVVERPNPLYDDLLLRAVILDISNIRMNGVTAAVTEAMLQYLFRHDHEEELAIARHFLNYRISITIEELNQRIATLALEEEQVRQELQRVDSEELLDDEGSPWDFSSPSSSDNTLQQSQNSEEISRENLAYEGSQDTSNYSMAENSEDYFEPPSETSDYYPEHSETPGYYSETPDYNSETPDYNSETPPETSDYYSAYSETSDYYSETPPVTSDYYSDYMNPGPSHIFNFQPLEQIIESPEPPEEIIELLEPSDEINELLDPSDGINKLLDPSDDINLEDVNVSEPGVSDQREISDQKSSETSEIVIAESWDDSGRSERVVQLMTKMLTLNCDERRILLHDTKLSEQEACAIQQFLLSLEDTNRIRRGNMWQRIRAAFRRSSRAKWLRRWRKRKPSPPGSVHDEH